MSDLSLNLQDMQKYAEVLGTHVIEDLDQVKYDLHHSMVEWCLQRDGVVVLANGDILASNPVSSVLHECERHLNHHGLECGKVFPTISSVIAVLKERAEKTAASKDENISEGHRQLRALIASAVGAGASDIHMVINPSIKQTIVKFRVNGDMTTYAKWTDELGIKVHSIAYNHLSSNKQDAFSMYLPQDMSFTETFPDLGDIRIRSSNIGIKNGGCKVIYRVLSIGKFRAPDLSKLGYLPDQEALLREIPNLGNGIVMFCGETGSGKTTSLASLLTSVDPRKSVYSLEDPVEIYIDHVDQCPVDTRSDKRGFAYYLRALLRADPDVIMLGEIRDPETAKIAIQGALTGHLIMSTLHTRYAVNAVMRLHEQGIPLKNLATPGLLKMLIAQQLYPQMCRACARKLNDAEKEIVKDRYTKEQLDIIETCDKESVCRECMGTGISGRKVYAEMIKVDRKGREFIAEMDIRGWEKYLKSQGFISMDERVEHDINHGLIDALSLKALETAEVDEFTYNDVIQSAK